MSWTAGSLASDCGGELHGAADTEVRGVSTDTRTLAAGDLFVALGGESHDGHVFAEAAVAAGAVVLLLGRAPAADPGVPWIRVHDTLSALAELARAHRGRFAGPVVAITGSNGKTTTKELCAGMLERAGLRVHRTPGNLNNHIGLPLTVLGLRDADALVVEMGMNHPGEIAHLVGIAGPDVAAITNVAPAHLGPLGSIEAIARAKGEIYEGLGPAATAVFNADDAHVRAQVERFSGARLGFGHGADCALRASDERLECGCPVFTLNTPGGAVPVRMRAPGVHLVEDALCAAACAVAARPGIPPEALRHALEAFTGVPGRALARETSDGLRILDDTYNANPASVRAALHTLVELRGQGRAIAVLGDMLELGADAEALHAGCGREAAAAGVHALIGVGALAAHACEAARAAGMELAECAADPGAAAARVRELARPGDAILVKGSRGMRMERTVSALVGED